MRSVKQDTSDLEVGSVIQFDKKANEPVDIFVNDKLIAKGTVVVIDERFGVRISELVSDKVL